MMADAKGLHIMSTSEARRPMVAVIGAGVAGLSAAQWILQADRKTAVDLAVFEASDRIGGRIHTCKFGKGSIERGAAWVHGYSPENPLYDIALEHQLGPTENLAHGFDRTKLEQRNEDGDSVSLSEYIQLEHLFNIFLDHPRCGASEVIQKDPKGDKLKEFLNGEAPQVLSRPVTSSDLGGCIYPTLLSLLSHLSERDSHSKDKDLFPFLQQLVSEELISNGCPSLYDINVDGYSEYIDLPGRHVALTKGYSSLIESLRSGIPSDCLHLNHPVEKVEWMPQKDGDPPVRLHFKDGTTYQADIVLVTASLGYLKHNAGHFFQPGLPENKVQAIRTLGFGVVNKIQMQYNKPFWTPGWNGVHLLWNSDSFDDLEGSCRPKEEWFKRIALFRPAFYNEDVLEALVPGREGRHLESLGTSAVKAVVTGILRKFLSDPSIPEPDQLVITKWSSEPYIRGSYSYIAAGASIDDTERLAEPVTVTDTQGTRHPRVCFAGEATSRQFYSTVHGALLSGRREAERILDFAESITARTQEAASQ